MSEQRHGSKVLIVDDQLHDIGWLIRLLRRKGYTVELESNEMAAREHLKKIAAEIESGATEYVLAIFDIMVAIKDLMDLEGFGEEFYRDSKDSGIRLCEFARNGLRISEEHLPIVCLSVREDKELKDRLGVLRVRLFNRSATAQSEYSIRDFINDNLPTTSSPIG